MINSIIIRFDIIFDDDNDFRKIFTTKICQLEELINTYPSKPINSMREINKNYAKYKNLMTTKKRNEHIPFPVAFRMAGVGADGQDPAGPEQFQGGGRRGLG